MDGWMCFCVHILVYALNTSEIMKSCHLFKISYKWSFPHAEYFASIK